MNTAQDYAEALYEASQEKSTKDLKVYVRKMKSVLEEKKQEKILPEVNKKHQMMVLQGLDSDKTTLVVREEKAIAKYKKELSKHKKMFNVDDIEVVIDQEIVGGFIAKNNNWLLDRSYKRQLLEMYQRLQD